MMQSRRRFIITFLLVVLYLGGLFCRLYKIYEKTEFLGDQGSALTIVYNAVKERQLPLLGPRTSLGYYPGPAYYYMLFPIAVITNFNPVAPAVFFAVLGTASGMMLFVIGKKLFSTEAGLIAAMMYLFSPVLIPWNSRMWNPTTVPFFEILIISIILLRSLPRYLRYSSIGIFMAILPQLHPTTLLFDGAVLLLLFHELRKEWLSEQRRAVTQNAFAVVIGFFAVSLPYLYHEAIHGFENIKGFASVIFLGNGRTNLSDIISYTPFAIAETLINIIFPLPSLLAIVTIVALIILSIRQRKSIQSLMSLFLFTNIFILMLYPQQLYIHYVIYLVPVLILNLAWLCSSLIPSGIRLHFVTVVIAVFLVTTVIGQIQQQGQQDIPRTEEVTKQMLRMARNEPFAFTLSKTRSFSDYHYRFFLTLAQAEVVPIQSVANRKLYIICESGDCPSEMEMKNKWGMKVLCFDHFCEDVYPEIKLNGVYDLRRYADIEKSRIYEFIRI